MGGAAPFNVADEERWRVRAREEERAERGGREAAVDAVAALVHVQLDEGVPAIWGRRRVCRMRSVGPGGVGVAVAGCHPEAVAHTPTYGGGSA